ncbi:GGDEF domain-containing protein [Rhodococcus sp. KBS0724]|uniref:GGDEF domain-containing protein n=1 Tax=Rhodococcus sp. KBS0724 TaxID=1179674 RepID=UPI00110EB42F|nr:GGDEF domain-containing protein [Rhodococcus sp. KBS0724]TSD45908.1 GGDEF domain-containing protein [Rhodococcus sp. KBS0724]
MTSFGADRSHEILPAARERDQSALRSAIALLVQWFRRPDQFDSFTRYLASKGLEVAVRLIVISSCVAVVVAMLLLRFSEAGVHNQVTSVINAVIIAGTVGMIVLFSLLPALTRKWSYLFVAYAELGVVVGVFLNRDPFIGLIQCIVFVLVGGYIAYFHNARLQTAHMVLSGVILVLIARQVAVYEDPALAIALSLVVAASIVVIPFASQFVLSILGSDAESSDVDPLTGLLNRRGLQRSVEEWGVAEVNSRGLSCVVVIVDVDNFKTVNDSYGHEQGDMVLREFAVRLRRCGSNHALFSRFGGDEFVLVDMIGKRAELELEENLRRHMRLPDSVPVVTTSIGIAIPSTSRSTDISQVELAGLFRLADAAMYQAKASGGDRVIVTHTQL